jgi:ADP-heptose:LPS heptosyltransferase
MNRVDENLELCNVVTGTQTNIANSIHIDKQINIDVFRAITEKRKDCPWLVLVHAPVERPEKRWPAERYASVIDLLMEDGRFDVVLTHGPGQRQMLTTILLKCANEPIVPPACDSLREFAGLAASASLYVGADTGPMHIAAAVGTPVVAIFGGTAPSMHRPIGASSRILGGVSFEDRVDRVSLEESLDVLEAVTAEDVFTAAVELLEESGSIGSS